MRRRSWLVSPAAWNCSRPMPTTIAAYKRRLIEYLERFMGDLIRRSDAIARTLHELSASIDAVLRQVAEREARDAAPWRCKRARR